MSIALLRLSDANQPPAGKYLKRYFLIPFGISRFEILSVYLLNTTDNQEVSIEKFTQPHQSKPYNPTMAAVFYKCGFIENWGKGTLNIINECLEYGLPKPTFEFEWEAVKTTFYISAKDRLGETQLSIIKLMQNDPKIAIVALSQELKKSTTAVEKHIKLLKEQNIIQRIGSAKGGYWEVKDS